MCTRMICHIKKYSYILKLLNSVLINELLVDAHDDLKNVFELMCCENIKSVLSLNCFIDHVKLNNSCISDEQQNFYDINHSSLVFVNFLTVASRVTINYLYRNLTKKWHSGFLARPLEEPLHDVYICLIVAFVKVLCKLYIKHFSYEGFLNIFDKLSSNEVSDSFTVISNKKMSSKLLGCLLYRLNKVFHQNLVIVWQDISFRIHAVFHGDKFLNDL